MIATVTVQLPTYLLQELIARLRRDRGTQDMSEGVAHALRYWLDAEQPSAAPDQESGHGYQWKTVFLPDGTLLRSSCGGATARVELDHIIHQGRAVTPNQFAQAGAGSVRNAWKVILVRRPGERRFKPACLLRDEIARIERDKAALRAHAALQATRPVPPDAAAPLAPAAPLGPLAPWLPELAQAQQAPQAPAPAHPPRDTSPRANWDLPERRSMRYRLEDAAFG